MADQKPTTAPANGAAAPAPAPATNVRPCPRDCTRCSFQQHAFCAAKMAYEQFNLMSQVLQRLDAMSAAIADLATRVAELQSSAENLASPTPVQSELFPKED